MSTHWTEDEWRCPSDGAFHMLDLSKGDVQTDMLPCTKCGNLCTPGLIEDGMANTTGQSPKADAQTEREQHFVEMQRMMDVVRTLGLKNPSSWIPPARTENSNPYISEQIMPVVPLVIPARRNEANDTPRFPQQFFQGEVLQAKHLNGWLGDITCGPVSWNEVAIQDFSGTTYRQAVDSLDPAGTIMSTSYDFLLTGSALSDMGVTNPEVGSYIYHDGKPGGAVLRYDRSTDEARVHFFAQPPQITYSLSATVLDGNDDDHTSVPTNLRVPGDFELREQFCVRMTLVDGSAEDDPHTWGDLWIAEQRIRQLMYARPELVCCEIVKVWKRVES